MSIVEISNLILLEVIFCLILFIGMLYIVLKIQYYLTRKRERHMKKRKEVNS